MTFRDGKTGSREGNRVCGDTAKVIHMVMRQACDDKIFFIRSTEIDAWLSIT